MILKKGMSLFAKKTVYMTYRQKDKALVGNKKYIIKYFEDDYFVIDSELGFDHYWGREDADKYFRATIGILNKNIKIL